MCFQTLTQQRRHPGLDLSCTVLDLEQKLADMRTAEHTDQAKLGFFFGPQVRAASIASVHPASARTGMPMTSIVTCQVSQRRPAWTLVVLSHAL